MSRSHFSLIRSALTGGVLSTVIIFLGTYLLGNLSDAEAIENLQEIRPTLALRRAGQ